MTTPRPLVIKCTSGAEAPERAAQAFTVAATAAASGSTVSLWLTGDAVWFAVPGKAEQFELPHSAPLQDLRDTVLSTGTLIVCTPRSSSQTSKPSSTNHSRDAHHPKQLHQGRTFTRPVSGGE